MRFEVGSIAARLDVFPVLYATGDRGDGDSGGGEGLMVLMIPTVGDDLFLALTKRGVLWRANLVSTC